MTDTAVSLQDSVPYRVRQTIGPWVNHLVTALGQPTCQVRPKEYVATVDCPIADLESKLLEDGFSWAPFSLYHRTPQGTRPDGSWTRRSSVLAERQLHVILFAHAPETVHVYAHTEYNWLRHPLKHLRQVGIDRAAGAGQVRKWLEESDLRATHESRVSRVLLHSLERLRERLSSPERRARR